MNAGLAPIPWRFQDSSLSKIWQWQTPHFEVTVIAELGTFAWVIGDLIVPNKEGSRFLAEGRTSDFATAEREVRETIGKSYGQNVGYRSYSGALATTFTLATGERVDLGQYNGQAVVVTVRLPSGRTQKIIGGAAVIHYELHVTPRSGSPVKIQPPHIVSVVREGGGGASSQVVEKSLAGRIYKGSITRGCTGKPGFMSGTIDHTGRTCPVHEEGGTGFSGAPGSR